MKPDDDLSEVTDAMLAPTLSQLGSIMRAGVVLIFAFLPGGGLAQGAPPKIDGTKYCDAISGFYGANPPVQKSARENCLKNETDFAAKLTHIWSKVPANDREDCQKLLALSQLSNQGLAGCVGLAMGQHFLNGDLSDCR